MQVFVKLYATLRKFAPAGTDIGESFTVNLEKGIVSELIDRLGIPENQARIILINGTRVSDIEEKLKPDDLIVIFPPIGGG
ncbi:MAG: MoaD/ThiS family protein [Candidatus Helarchaeota archaeon]|nr:MoaD/ThiS family protein [Candidatus Helarchaeota archaeon]